MELDRDEGFNRFANEVKKNFPNNIFSLSFFQSNLKDTLAPLIKFNVAQLVTEITANNDKSLSAEQIQAMLKIGGQLDILNEYIDRIIAGNDKDLQKKLISLLKSDKPENLNKFKNVLKDFLLVVSKPFINPTTTYNL